MRTSIPAFAKSVVGRVVGGRRPPGPTVDGFAGKGHVRVEEHRVDQIRDAFPGWDDLRELEEVLGETFRDQPDPLDAARIAALDRLRPVDVVEARNTQLQVFHENIVDVYDPNQSVSALSASHCALGTDGSSTAYGDTALTNEVYREAVDSSTDNGNDLKTQTLLDETEGNGNTYKEVGLVSASSGGTFFNHALISDKEKTDQNTLTIEIVLQFRAV